MPEISTPFKPEIEFENDPRHDIEQSPLYYDFCVWLYEHLTTETGESFDGYPWVNLGRDTLPSGPFIAAPMHRKFLDIPMAGSVLKQMGADRAHFISKYENHYPFEILAKKHLNTDSRLGRLALSAALKLDSLEIRNMRMGGRNFPFDRENPRPYLKQMKEWLRESFEDYGQPVNIFPEGTRKKEDTHLVENIQPGATHYAMMFDMPVVPISFWGDHSVILKKWELFKNGRPVSRLRKDDQTPLTVFVGEPLVPQEYIAKYGTKGKAKKAMQADLETAMQLGLDICKDYSEQELAPRLIERNRTMR